MTVDEIIDVITVRNRWVSTIGTVLVASVVAVAFVVWRAGCRIGSAHLKSVLFDARIRWVVQVTIV